MRLLDRYAALSNKWNFEKNEMVVWTKLYCTTCMLRKVANLEWLILIEMDAKILKIRIHS